LRLASVLPGIENLVGGNMKTSVTLKKCPKSKNKECQPEGGGWQNETSLLLGKGDETVNHA